MKKDKKISLTGNVKNNSRKHTKYLDILRIIAVISILVIHISGENMAWEEISRRYWGELNLLNSISRFGVPVFLMISGVLFLDSEKAVDGRYLLFKILRILTAYLVWSLFYAIVFYRHNKTAFISHVISGYGHLWFIFMIIGLYIIVPLLRQIVLSKRTEKYFLILSFVFAFVINDAKMEIHTFLPEISNNVYYKALLSDYARMYIYMPLGYAGYFVLGHYIHMYLRVILKKKYKLYRLICSAFFVCGGGYYNVSDSIFV